MIERTQPQVTEPGPARIEGDGDKGSGNPVDLDEGRLPADNNDWRDRAHEAGELPAAQGDAGSLLDDDGPDAKPESAAENRQEATDGHREAGARAEGLSNSLLDGGDTARAHSDPRENG